jgi:hypothetical protein
MASAIMRQEREFDFSYEELLDVKASDKKERT